ncbi:MAG: DNA recombination protein RmuC [Phycisphaerae bacterium]
MNETIFVLIGLLIGAAVVLLVVTLRRRQEAIVAQHLLEETQRQKTEELAALTQELKTAFSALSREALSANTDDFLKLAKERLQHQTTQGEQSLESKKKLIDARVEEMSTKLTQLNDLIQSVEKQRVESHGSLKAQLEKATQTTTQLQQTTAQLREALANPQRRGQWGERMAEDVLRLAGFVEGVNYQKQQQIGQGTRPDYTFILPGDRRVHMDVKFPLVNYLKMLDAKDDAERAAGRSQFLKDVRSRVKEVTTRDYIDPASGTVDYVLVFIPNEHVYGFIHEADSNLLDDALRNKVVLCSPMTLYAILAVIRQAIDTFRLEQSSRQILELLAEFKKQWGKYVDGMDAMGKRLEDATKKYQELVGTRTRQLERQLDKIDDLRAARSSHTEDLLPPSDRSVRSENSESAR